MKRTLATILAAAALASPLAAQQPRDSTQQLKHGLARVLEFAGTGFVRGPGSQYTQRERYISGVKHTYQLTLKDSVLAVAQRNNWYADLQANIRATPTDAVLIIEGEYKGRQFTAFDLGANGTPEFGILFAPDSTHFARGPKETQFLRQAYWNAVAKF